MYCVQWGLLLLASALCDTLASHCKVTVIPPRRSYRYFRLELDHVQCFNPGRVEGVTECRGGCESRSGYSPENKTLIIRDCWCCIPAGEPDEIEVAFECRDGRRFMHKVGIPRQCECRSCDIFDDVITEIPIAV
ncbi:hypothetical protein BIW11_01796 [Tropilaelaps mercedesae]|uniref:CTCK domain-containing protein n=1 Tax=Tropilaelaps mercedesae TaxID=418985 RepID=A0A1V9X8N3_9ACAR|nr:hypothetical protein BIW11_01796 [Tropilaelaps mercedesae]